MNIASNNLNSTTRDVSKEKTVSEINSDATICDTSTKKR